MTFPLLTVLAVTPLVGALILALLRGTAAKAVGLLVSLVTLALAIWVFVLANSGVNLSEQVAWFRPLGAYYALGVDGMGLTMLLLTAILTPIVLLAEWFITEQRGATGARWSSRTFFALVLVLESFSLFVFAATDVLLFYLFFEATLIPMYFLIAGWGGPDRAKAAIKFLIYSLAGGLIMLVAVAGLYAVSAAAGKPSYLISDLAALHISGSTGQWLFLGFFIAFAIKAPLVPVHTWLPDTAEQGSPGAATMLVGILDKIGTFGMMRFCLGLFPDASKWATPVILVLALISIIWGALMAVGSKNLMRLISYTSISHFGFMVFGIFALTSVSMTGSVFYMLNHGFSTAALFLVAGFIVHRRGSAEISDFGGVQKIAPVLAGMFLVSGLSGLALPGMSSFVSEFMVMAGAWQRYPWLTAIAALGTVLAALYILLMYQRTMTGPVPEEVASTVRTDATGREKLVMAPLIALMLVLGFFPKPMLEVIEPTVKDTMSYAQVTDPAPKEVK